MTFFSRLKKSDRVFLMPLVSDVYDVYELSDCFISWEL